ncbi:MAG: cell division protein FtsQ, partial [Bacteroidetes bacterium QS_4_64_154]
MTSESANTFTRRILRLAGVALLVAGVGALGVLGWRWRASATVDRVAVTGTQHAPPDSVRRLARVDSPHWTYGTLTVAVTERTPAALAVDRLGRPAYYLDRAGYAMPLPDSAGYDVPIVRGLDADAPWTRPDSAQSPSSLRRVLAALPDAGVADLVAEIEVRRDESVQLTTAPVGSHDAIPVRLGAGDVSKKLRTLRAFARQVLARRTDGPIEHIDLRF